MKQIYLLILLLILAGNAVAADSAQYIKEKQAHAEFLREQANDRVAYLRSNTGSSKPNLVSTGASLNDLSPAGGPTATPLKIPPSITSSNTPKLLIPNDSPTKNDTNFTNPNKIN